MPHVEAVGRYLAAAAYDRADQPEPDLDSTNDPDNVKDFDDAKE